MIPIDTIVQGDSIELLQSLPDGCAGLVLADPPYSINKTFGRTTPRRTLNDWIQWSRIWLEQAVRILSPKGNLMVYSLHHSAAFLHVILHDMGLLYRRQFIWHYENGFTTYRTAPPSEYEVILWFAWDKTSTFHVMRKPYKSQERLRHAINKRGKVWVPHPEGKREGDVWSFPTLAGRRFAKERVDHPSQKPLDLSNRLVRHFSNEGDLVVVPFVGSGTECIAARMNDRNYVGAEINPEYVELARRRLKEQTGPNSF